MSITLAHTPTAAQTDDAHTSARAEDSLTLPARRLPNTELATQ